MITPGEIETRIAAGVPGATVVVRDLTGTSDHYGVRVVSERFAGASSLERHRMIHSCLRDVLGGALHAIELVTKTPAEDAADSGSAGVDGRGRST